MGPFANTVNPNNSVSVRTAIAIVPNETPHNAPFELNLVI